MYRKLFLAHPVSHHLYARPWEATGHRRPREATGGHRRPREATGGHGPHPTVPPKILYLLKWAGRGRQKGRLRRKPATGGHGGPRGATGGHGAAPKKSRNTNRPLQYPRGPLQAAPVWGIYNLPLSPSPLSFPPSLSVYMYVCMYCMQM